MAGAKEEGGVVLGFVSSEIESDTDAYESKFGGWPIWLGPAPAEDAVRCGECGGSMLLVVQAYAPLAPARAHQRALCLFCCPKPKCSGLSRGWKAWRSQEGASAAALVADAAAEKPAAQPPPAPAEKVVGEFGDTSESTWDDEPGDGEPAWHASTAPAAPAADIDALIQMRDLALEQKAARAAAPPAKAPQRTAPGAEASAVRSKPRHEQTRWGVFLSAHYMEVDYEPPAAAAAPPEAELAHARELYDDYKRREAAGEAMGSESGSGEPWAEGEGYERAEGEERALLRFQKRLARCPEQALRYLSGPAEPLWASGPLPTPDAVPPCERCGGPRRAELQLMPPLLLHLNTLAPAPELTPSSSSGTPDEMRAALLDDGMDWATVTMFTCAASCGDEACSSPEVAFVQPPL